MPRAGIVQHLPKQRSFVVSQDVVSQQALARESARLYRSRYRLVSRIVERDIGEKVVSGPFQGLQMPPVPDPCDVARVAKILGTYEQELHTPLQRMVAAGPDALVNIGCAEGYYAAGLAKLAPSATVYAFDIDTRMQMATKEIARVNGLDGKIEIAGIADHENLSKIIERHAKTSLFVDCEGAEINLLDPSKVPGLGRCDIIVECHDFINPSITSTLTERFRDTHLIVRVEEGARNPNDFARLRQFNSMDRWLCVWENRPSLMWWLVMWAIV
jgi:hypothetical protein